MRFDAGQAAMKNTPKGAAESGETQDLAAFVGVVAGMSRFLTGLAGAAPFKEGGLSLAEWAALSVIAERKSLTGTQLAKALGISRQRVNQIGDALRQSSFISIEPSAANAHSKLLRITAAGRSQLETVNAALLPKISQLAAAHPTALRRMERMLRQLITRFVGSAGAVPERLDGTTGKDAPPQQPH